MADDTSNMSGDAQHQLIERYQSYVFRLARQVARSLPPHIPLDDLISYANLGLVRAAKRYEPGRGATFETFAYRIIRGAIYDGLRKDTGMPPKARRALKEHRRADDVLEETAARIDAASTPEHLASEFSEAVGRLGAVILMSRLSEEEQAGLEPATEERPDEPIITEETRTRLRGAIEDLKPADARLIDMLYFQGLSMEEAGRELGIHKANVSRRNIKIVDQLRQALSPG